VNKRELERSLSGLREFEDPDARREQYPTPADLAAHVVHLADLQGDLSRPVVDLGSGTGILAIGAALKGARTTGIEVDRAALSIARENARTAGVEVEWVLADATRLPVCSRNSTVLANPPFGAQNDSVGDRPFLEAAARIGTTSYTVHNGGSQQFVEEFAADNGGTVTHAFRAGFELERAFEFHDADSATVETEVFRVQWD
jgi:putative methylase